MKIAFHAGRHDPLGVVALAWDTYADFWDNDKIAQSLLVEEGRLELDDAMLEHFRSNYSEDLSKLQDTLVKRWHRFNVFWYRVVLLSPVFAVVLSLRRKFRGASIFIGVIVWTVALVACALVVEASVRYLHALAWLACIQFSVALCIARDFFGTQPLKLRSADLPSNHAARP